MLIEETRDEVSNIPGCADFFHCFERMCCIILLRYIRKMLQLYVSDLRSALLSEWHGTFRGVDDTQIPSLIRLDHGQI